MQVGDEVGVRAEEGGGGPPRYDGGTQQGKHKKRVQPSSLARFTGEGSVARSEKNKRDKDEESSLEWGYRPPRVGVSQIKGCG